MNALFEFQENILRSVKNDFRRYLHNQINWEQRMIGITLLPQLDFNKNI